MSTWPVAKSSCASRFWSPSTGGGAWSVLMLACSCPCAVDMSVGPCGTCAVDMLPMSTWSVVKSLCLSLTWSFATFARRTVRPRRAHRGASRRATTWSVQEHPLHMQRFQYGRRLHAHQSGYGLGVNKRNAFFTAGIREHPRLGVRQAKGRGSIETAVAPRSAGPPSTGQPRTPVSSCRCRSPAEHGPTPASCGRSLGCRCLPARSNPPDFRPVANTSPSPSTACLFQAPTWFGCTSCFAASS